jgi:hypothetical protein
MSARGQKIATVTRFSLKLGQNEQETANSKKSKAALSDGWQRDLVGFVSDSETEI